MSSLLAVVADKVGTLIVGSVLCVLRLFTLSLRLVNVTEFHWSSSGTLGVVGSGSTFAVAFYVVNHVGGTLSKCKRVCQRLRIHHCHLQLDVLLQTNNEFVAKVIVIWTIWTHLHNSVTKHLDVCRDTFGLFQPVEFVSQLVEVFNVREVFVQSMFKLIERVGLCAQSVS